MKILYVSSHPHLRTHSNAGYATHIRETVAALRDRGHDVETWIAGDELAAALGSGGRPGKSLLRRVVPGFAWRGMRDLSLVRHDRVIEEDLRAAVARFAPDVIYERAAYLSSAGVRVAVEQGVPLVLEVNAPYVEERRSLNGAGPMDGAGRRWERDVLRGASAVVTVSSVLKDRLVASSGIDPDRVHVQPNGADMAQFHAGVPSVRERLGLPRDAFVVCFVGSFIRWHRLEVLIEAVAGLVADGVPAYGLLVGDGDVREELEARARELGVEDRVVFTGTVPFGEVPAHIQTADACVIPGHAWYCSPIKLFEYGAVGKAAVSLDSAPVREVAEAGRECLYFDGSREQLQETLAALHADPARRQSLAAALHAVVADRFTWAAAAERLEAWMEALVARSEPGRDADSPARPVLP